MALSVKNLGSPIQQGDGIRERGSRTMQSMTPIEIFDEIEAMILEEPKRIRMELFRFYMTDLPEDQRPACGTVGCIAGWAVAIGLNVRGEKFEKVVEIEDMAQDFLDLNDRQTVRLFYEFPEEPWGTKEYAEAVVAHMEEFRKSVPHLRRKT